MNKKIVIVGLLGALGVGLGAFGAHGLQSLVSEQQLATYKTGVHYQMLHVLVLFIIALFSQNHPHKLLNRAFIAIFIGILLFSGSLYLLSTREVIGLTSWKWLGPITPLGGLSFIVGWLFIMFYGLRKIG